MAEVVRGAAALRHRMAAVQGAGGSRIMRTLGLSTVREAKLLVHRRTGNLGRSIRVESVTDRQVTVIASARYAAFVELGTRAHEITPKAKQALRWAQGAAGGPFRRLSGAPRAGAPAGAFMFARRVHHPGTKPYPYLVPGAKRAVAKGDLKDVIIDVWNAAG